MQKENLYRSAKSTYDYLLDNLGRPCTLAELIQNGNIYDDEVPVSISPSDINLIRQRIFFCRNYLKVHPDIGLSIFLIRGSKSYILSDSREVGSQFPIPMEFKDGMQALTNEELEFLSLCEVKEKDYLLRKLPDLELDILLTLCKSYLENPNRPVSLKEIQRKVFNSDIIESDIEKVDNIRTHVHLIRHKLSNSNMKIATISRLGYKFERS